jgi:hypothetical protein
MFIIIHSQDFSRYEGDGEMKSAWFFEVKVMVQRKGFESQSEGEKFKSSHLQFRPLFTLLA